MTSGPRTRFARLYVHVFASAACVLPVASYVLADFGWRPADIGFGVAAIGVAGTVFSPFWGWLDDRTGWAPRGAILVTAAAAVGAAFSLGRLPHAATWLALAFFGAAEGPMDALLTARVLASGVHRSRLGALRSFGSLGWVLGLALAATVLTLLPGHPELVLVAAACTAVTSPRSWGGPPATLPATAPGRRATVGHEAPLAAGPRSSDALPVGRRRVPLRPLLSVVAVTLPTSVAMSAIVQFTAGWAHAELAAGAVLALAPIALSALLELPVLPWVDRLVRARSPLLVTVLAGPPLTLATAMLAAFPSIVSVLAVQPLIGVSFSLLFVGQSRLLAATVTDDRHASAQTLGSALITGGGGLIAGVVGGWVADRLGYGGLLASLTALTAVGSAVGGLALLRVRRDATHPVTPCRDDDTVVR